MVYRLLLLYWSWMLMLPQSWISEWRKNVIIEQVKDSKLNFWWVQISKTRFCENCDEVLVRFQPQNFEWDSAPKVKAFLENVWKLACSEPVQEFYISKIVALVFSPPLSKGHECLCSLFVHVVSLKPGFKSTDTDRRVEYYIVVTMDHVFKMNHLFKKQNRVFSCDCNPNTQIFLNK